MQLKWLLLVSMCKQVVHCCGVNVLNPVLPCIQCKQTCVGGHYMLKNCTELRNEQLLLALVCYFFLVVAWHSRLIGMSKPNHAAFHTSPLWYATSNHKTPTMALRFTQRAQAGVVSSRQQAPAPVVRVPSAAPAARCNISQMAASGALASTSSSRANQAPVVRCR
jgi:hypothetical protein